jgi:hypothetical protein
MTARRALRTLFLLAAALAVASPADAYLDPSTGSMVISALVGIVAATALAAKMFWYRVAGLLRGTARRRGRKSAADEGA